MPANVAPYPNMVQEQLPAVYGPPVRRSDVPLTSMAAVERQVLADTLQQYDTNIPLEHDEFMGDLMRQGGLLGLDLDVALQPVMRPLPTSGAQMKRCRDACATQPRSQRRQCVMACVSGRKPRRGVLKGLGAEVVTRPVPEPVKASTIYLVMGGAALLLAGSIALWWFSKE